MRTTDADGDAVATPRNTAHARRVREANPGALAVVAKELEHRPVSAQRARTRGIGTRFPFVGNRFGACKLRIGGFESLDERTRRLCGFTQRIVAFETPQKLLHAFIVRQGARAFEYACGRREIVVATFELAVFSNPRIAAHVDRGAAGLPKQRLRALRRSVNELRAELRRRCDPRQRMRQHAAADAVARFEHQHSRRSPPNASRGGQTRRTGADDDDVCIR